LSGLDSSAEQIFNEAYQYYVDKDGWKVNKEGPDGAVIYAKKDKAKNKTIFKLEVRSVHASVEIMPQYSLTVTYISKYGLFYNCANLLCLVYRYRS
jgi:hypothetical protein